jgi:hypothetical protein
MVNRVLIIDSCFVNPKGTTRDYSGDSFPKLDRFAGQNEPHPDSGAKKCAFLPVQASGRDQMV